MIKGRLEGADKLVGDVQKISRRTFSEIKKTLATEARLMTSYTRKSLMSGPRPVLLGVRTGNLRAQTKPLPVTERPGLIESGMGFGTTYARPHVGPRGQITTIKPIGKAIWANCDELKIISKKAPKRMKSTAPTFMTWMPDWRWPSSSR